MRWPSAALVMALIAVAGAWAGPAVAGRLLTGKDIRDRSLTGREFKGNSLTGRVVGNLSGRDIKDDTLDGADIDEDALGKVRSAQTADRALVADAVAGGGNVIRVHFARPPATEAAVLEIAGLSVRASCSPTGTLAVTAATTSAVANVRVGGTRASGNSNTPIFGRDDDFRPGEAFDVVPGGADNAIGQLVYVNAEGATVTLDFLAEQSLPPTRGFTCLFAGTALHAPA